MRRGLTWHDEGRLASGRIRARCQQGALEGAAGLGRRVEAGLGMRRHARGAGVGRRGVR